MFFKILEVYEFERNDGGGIEIHLGRAVVVEGFLPAEDAEAPLVARLEAGEGELGAWGDQVVALVLAEG